MKIAVAISHDNSLNCLLIYLAIDHSLHEALRPLVSSVRARVANTIPSIKKEEQKGGDPKLFSIDKALLSPSND